MAVDSVNNNIQYQSTQSVQSKAVNAQSTVKSYQSMSKDAVGKTVQGQSQDPEAIQNADERIKSAVKLANGQMKHANTRCEFRYHEETKRVSIKVIDQDTDEVVREIPPEETLEMVEKMWELAGILVDERR